MVAKKVIAFSKWAVIPIFLACNWGLLLTVGYEADRSQYISCELAAVHPSTYCAFEFRLAPKYSPPPERFNRKDWLPEVGGIYGWAWMLRFATPILLIGWLLALHSQVKINATKNRLEGQL